jgi:hypothetical protein
MILGYVDPGVGAFLWQVIAASFLGILFYSKKIFLKIKKLVNRDKDDQRSSSEKD